MLCAIERIKTQIAGTDENEFGVWNAWHTSQKKQTKFESFKQELRLKWVKRIENEIEKMLSKDHLWKTKCACKHHKVNTSIIYCANFHNSVCTCIGMLNRESKYKKTWDVKAPILPYITEAKSIVIKIIAAAKQGLGFIDRIASTYQKIHSNKSFRQNKEVDFLLRISLAEGILYSFKALRVESRYVC